MQSLGFKEWALVCAALGEGRQSVIIRKGGLAEGRDGFAFRHREFFLFPTFFHEQLTRLRLSAGVLPESRPNEIEIRYFVRVEEARVMTNWTDVRALQPLHILRESVVRERFDYENMQECMLLSCELSYSEPVWRLPDAKAYGGCRSWVHLPEPPAGLRLHPVVEE
jgi:hypothetical protein